MTWADRKLADVEQALRYLQSQFVRFAKVPRACSSVTIRFEIVSAGSTSAEVTILGASCGCGIHDTYGSLTVYDALGCLLSDEEPADLVGRTGYATRMRDLVTDECRWEIISLCCPGDGGGDDPI